MLAELSSPPPDARPSPQPTTAVVAGKKRKRGGQQQQPAASPAPSDSGTPEYVFISSISLSTFLLGLDCRVLTSRTDLFSRPQLKVSRGPVFTAISEGSQYHKTDLIGVNRVGFRYVPAGIKPQLQSSSSSSPKPVIQFCTIESNPTSYRISWEDRSPFIHVTKDGLGLLGSKGHRSARGNAPVREGKWYMEVKIIKGGGVSSSNEGMREGCHLRLGWGRREAPLNGPVGLDGYSYGFRDKTGEKVTVSRPRPYGRHFGNGDVIGMYISLPSKREPDAKDPTDPAHLKRERIAIDFKGQEMFEMQEYPQSKEMIALMDYDGKTANSTSLPSTTATKKAGVGRGGLVPPNGTSNNNNKSKNTTTNLPINTLRPLPTLPDSRVAFFVNGQCQGDAFRDLYDYLQLRQSERKIKENKKKYREGLKESHKDNPFDDGSLGYYPFISLFNDAEVRINPGPEFDYPPPEDIDALLDGMDANAIIPDNPDSKPISNDNTWRPISSRYSEYMSEQWEFDEREEREALDNLAEVTAQEKAAVQKKAQRERQKAQKEKNKRAKVQQQVKEQSPSVGAASTHPSGIGSISQPQPSPLRQASVTTYGEHEEYKHSPAAIIPDSYFTYAAPETPSSPAPLPNAFDTDHEMHSVDAEMHPTDADTPAPSAINPDMHISLNNNNTDQSDADNIVEDEEEEGDVQSNQGNDGSGDAHSTHTNGENVVLVGPGVGPALWTL
ncbi:COMPASS complex protein [Lentinula aciculospora]|uniref:COMPASS complex protein n=1 Tax=Lentinula aciculospora TaxID=153920 RepID=A0A9W9ASB0_9AGAR|nr:COMPASS complex protein [Lentinula aciculospora]